MAFRVYLALSFVVFAVGASPLKPAFWKGTALDSIVEKMRSSCDEDDSLACFQYKAFTVLDTFLQKDNFHLTENVEVTRNSYGGSNEISRSDHSTESRLEEYIKSHNVKFSLPEIGSVTVDARDLDSESIDFKLDFSSGRAVEARKKSKLKKIFIPILVFILLKAITLVPFAIGVLGLKAWNGLQLAFFSFIISTGLAIFQICQKLAADSAHAHAHIAAAPAGWEAVAARNINEEANKMAYSAYA